MVNAEALRLLLDSRPFVPFRLLLSVGGSVEVRHREVVSVGRHFALVGLVDPGAADTLFDRWVVVWYLHVTRAELLSPGLPPFSSPPESTPTPSPA